MTLYHGTSVPFMLTFDADLGDVGLASVHWKYDHDLDVLKLTKTCILFCSDALYVDRVSVSAAHECREEEKAVGQSTATSATITTVPETSPSPASNQPAKTSRGIVFKA